MKIALIGNPNVGKTSVFNVLTGLNQHTGNYPGVTVEKKTGRFVYKNHKINLTDLPGVYSIHPKSLDEQIALEVVTDTEHPNHPDVIVVVAEIENLKRNLLLFSQIQNLGIPTILCINMTDQMEKKGITIDCQSLEEVLKSPVVLISSKKREGIEELKEVMISSKGRKQESGFDVSKIKNTYFDSLVEKYQENAYSFWLKQMQDSTLEEPTKEAKDEQLSAAQIKKIGYRETIKRYQWINEVLKATYQKNPDIATGVRMKFDRIFTHKVYGLLIFFLIMLVIFGSIFQLATIPMDFVDEQFANLSEFVATTLPEGKINDLIANGIIPGVGGVMIFVPQIAILIFFVSILEESGYMSRVVFLMDKFMRPFGLNGKSVVPLISGTACAIPAIMSARNIENPTERLITMLITPFTTCSARIPVYIIIISLIIPEKWIFGFIPLQGLVMTMMYLLGFLGALVSGYILSKIIRSKTPSHFIIEMPTYKWPLLKNVGLNIYEKVISYIKGAGKIILSLSIILWFLGSHGPGATFGQAETIVSEEFSEASAEDLDKEIAKYKLEHSYIGIMGKTIEPVFKPLGYDWKISIAVLTSFAAREVFVGNLATIYSLGDDSEDEMKIIDRMRQEVRPDGTPVFTFATGISLLLFYAFAMQCLSTVAITKKETNSWKWTLIQLGFMTAFAYIASCIAYQILK